MLKVIGFKINSMEILNKVIIASASLGSNLTDSINEAHEFSKKHNVSVLLEFYGKEHIIDKDTDVVKLISEWL